jgi:hypothetical protein
VAPVELQALAWRVFASQELALALLGPMLLVELLVLGLA